MMRMAQMKLAGMAAAVVVAAAGSGYLLVAATSTPPGPVLAQTTGTPASRMAPATSVAANAATSGMLDGVKVLDVEFAGNAHIDSQILLDMMRTQPPLTTTGPIQGKNAVAWGVRGVVNPQPYARATLDEDVRTLASLGRFNTIRAETWPAVSASGEKGVRVRIAVEEKPVVESEASADMPVVTVQHAFAALHVGDAEAALRCFDALTPEQAATLRQGTRVEYTFDQLNEALISRFGHEAAASLKLERFNMGLNPRDIGQATSTMTENRAMVDIGGSGPGRVPLVKAGGVWKIEARVLESLDAADVYGVALLVPSLSRLTIEIRAGKYETLEEALTAARSILERSNASVKMP